MTDNPSHLGNYVTADRQHPEVTGDPARSPRAWLFTVARNMIIDEQRSARFRNESVILPDPDADPRPRRPR